MRIESRTSTMALISIILGGCIAISFLSLKYIGKNTDFEDAATFGAETSSIMASVDGYRIHCHDSRDAKQCIAGVKARQAANTALWLGNSQVHAVNQLKEGETNASPIIFNNLKDKNIDFITFSQPNANLQEHYVLFEHLRLQFPVKLLVLAAVFDDTREDGVRKEISDFLGDIETAKAVSVSSIGSRLIKSNVATVLDKSNDTAGISHTLQERVELVLNTWLEAASPLWVARPEIRGQIMTSLYIWRNTVLGIKPTSKRKIIRSRYQDNLAALDATLASAAHQGISVVLYIVPLRNDVEVPYLESEYLRYKMDVQALAARYGATFANLENLVPANLWGQKPSTSAGGAQELDFMHFQAGGHRLLAGSLAELVASAFAQQASKQ